MDARHAALQAVQEEGPPGLTGRTLLQKKLYFASLLVGEDLGFRPHYYGPFSREVADATDSLVSNGFLEQQIERFPDTNVFGERRRHSYRLTDDGRHLLAAISRRSEVTKWRAALEKINQHEFAKDFNLLSIAAKVRAIVSGAGRASVADIAKKAENYGWNLSPQEVKGVLEFLEYLGLVNVRLRSPRSRHASAGSS